jgi:N-acetyl-beta-hexosaminidase
MMSTNLDAGHTRSWGEAHPELLTTCYGASGAPDGSLGPMDPTKNFTYAFVAKFFREVAKVFPDKFLHIGGDEVDFNCWYELIFLMGALLCYILLYRYMQQQNKDAFLTVIIKPVIDLGFLAAKW